MIELAVLLGFMGLAYIVYEAPMWWSEFTDWLLVRR